MHELMAQEYVHTAAAATVLLPRPPRLYDERGLLPPSDFLMQQ